MFVRSFRSILDECLTDVIRGASVEECLARYPRQAERLRPHLRLVARLRTIPAAQPANWAKDNAWNAVRERAADLRTSRRRRRRAAAASRSSFNHGIWMRPLAVSLVLVMAFFAAGGATALAAQDALPDSPLYRVKLATEDARLWFVFDETQEAEILLDQSDERTDEITEMVEQGKEVPSNVLSALSDRNERAAGIIVADPSTELLGAMLLQYESQERLLVEVWGSVEDGALDEYREAVAITHNTRLQGSGDFVAAIEPEDLAGGVQRVSGPAQPVSDGVWSINGFKVSIDETTIGNTNLRAGVNTRFVLARNSRGDLRALSLIIDGQDTPASSETFVGEIDDITEDGIWIAGQFIRLSPDTISKLKVKEGERVEVTAHGGVAEIIKPAATPSVAAEARSLTIEGTIDFEDVDSTSWQIGSLTVEIPADTEFDFQAGPAEDGARALVEATLTDDVLEASSVTVLAAERDEDEMYVVGTFQGREDDVWMVSGLALLAPDVDADPPEGSVVAIEAAVADDELEVQDFVVVETPRDGGLATVQGVIEDIEDDTVWTLDAATVSVAEADVSGEAAEGVRALIWGREGGGGVIEATYVRILDETPIVEPVLEPTPSATPSASSRSR